MRAELENRLQRALNDLTYIADELAIAGATAIERGQVNAALDAAMTAVSAALKESRRVENS